MEETVRKISRKITLSAFRFFASFILINFNNKEQYLTFDF